MRKGKISEQITITEETYLEGANVTLEPGDVIEVYSAGTEYEIIKEGMADVWTELTIRDWESMTVDQLEQFSNINMTGMYRWTALMYASENNSNLKVTQYLIDKGADVNARNDDGETALLLASANNSNPKVIKLLIHNGADVNVKADYGITPLMFASVYNRNLEIIQFLIDNGAEVNARNRKEETALFLANNSKRKDVVQLLIDNGATE